jgi:hypothetical protein
LESRAIYGYLTRDAETDEMSVVLADSPPADDAELICPSTAAAVGPGAGEGALTLGIPFDPFKWQVVRYVLPAPLRTQCRSLSLHASSRGFGTPFGTP